MSFRRTNTRPTPTDGPKLEARLRNEFDSPSPDADAQPIIRAEPAEPAPISRLFVIWDDWAHLSQRDRSEIIMNAYLSAKGEADALKVGIAMGLTTDEAVRMGMQ